jgi:hypothetical protein
MTVSKETTDWIGRAITILLLVGIAVAGTLSVTTSNKAEADSVRSLQAEVRAMAIDRRNRWIQYEKDRGWDRANFAEASAKLVGLIKSVDELNVLIRQRLRPCKTGQ